jgi:hypothetical protein
MKTLHGEEWMGGTRVMAGSGQFLGPSIGLELFRIETTFVARFPQTG